MTPEQQQKVRELRTDPVFMSILDDLNSHKKPTQWKTGKSLEELANAAGYSQGIDFVLHSLGYANGR